MQEVFPMASVNRMKTVLIVVSVLLIVAVPYASSILVQRLQMNATLGFLAGIVLLGAGLIALVYSLKGQPLS